jgi:hypothetical protein
MKKGKESEIESERWGESGWENKRTNVLKIKFFNPDDSANPDTPKALLNEQDKLLQKSA